MRRVENLGPRPLAGGLFSRRGRRRPWRWSQAAQRTQAATCAGDQWYLVRGAAEHSPLIVHFERDGNPLEQTCIQLTPITQEAREHVGWLRTPPSANGLSLEFLRSREGAVRFPIRLIPVDHEEIQGHVFAATPRWSSYELPLTIERVWVPESMNLRSALRSIGPDSPGIAVSPLRRPASLAALAGKVRGAACILDPAWVKSLNIRLDDCYRLADESVVVIDLETYVALLRQARIPVRLRTPVGRDTLLAGQIEYADSATRGFALLDTLPLCHVDARGRFALRAVECSAAWRRHARATDTAMLVSAQTPWESPDLLMSGLRVGERGRLLVTDLPWLVEGRWGNLLTPQTAVHLLRAHLGLPVDEAAQYWVPTVDSDLLVRDIADLAHRTRPLRAVRWAPHDGGAVLGMQLEASTAPKRELVIDTGWLERCEQHAGFPPEAMVVFMRWLAREAQSRSDWAARHLDGLCVTWRFAARTGLKYVSGYPAGAHAPDSRVIRLRRSGVSGNDRWVIPSPAGCLADGSLELPAQLRRVFPDMLARAWPARLRIRPARNVATIAPRVRNG